MRRRGKRAAGDDFAGFVEHPRYGRGPRITGLNPAPAPRRPGQVYVYLHWHSSEASRIPDTAVVADLSRQRITTMGVTHYFDERRTCRACGADFIFFADEQKHWYEELQFPLEADCRDCVHCRKAQQELARQRKRYEELAQVPISARSEPELLEMAECCLSLVEASVFPPQQTSHVRALLNRVPEPRGRRLRTRLRAVEASIAATPTSPRRG